MVVGIHATGFPLRSHAPVESEHPHILWSANAHVVPDPAPSRALPDASLEAGIHRCARIRDARTAHAPRSRPPGQRPLRHLGPRLPLRHRTHAEHRLFLVVGAGVCLPPGGPRRLGGWQRWMPGRRLKLPRTARQHECYPRGCADPRLARDRIRGHARPCRHCTGAFGRSPPWRCACCPYRARSLITWALA